jgi:hypothetical protein
MRNLFSAALVLVLYVGFALAQDADKLNCTVKLVDVDKGKMLVTIVKDGGIRVVEYDLGKEVKFVDQKGKPLKGGLAADAFKSATNRPATPVTITFNKDGGVKQIKLAPPPPK